MYRNRALASGHQRITCIRVRERGELEMIPPFLHHGSYSIGLKVTALRNRGKHESRQPRRALPQKSGSAMTCWALHSSHKRK
jgi:hypothetical protein